MKPFKNPLKETDSFNLSLDMGNGKLSIDERKRNIKDYYITFKIEINKEYFMMKSDKNVAKRRGSARLTPLDQTNAFNFNLQSGKAQKNARKTGMNTSIDQINRGKRSKEFQELFDVYSIGSDKEKKRYSGFFMGANKEMKLKDDDEDPLIKKKLEKEIYSFEVKNYQHFPTTKFKNNQKPKFSLDVNEYHAPKKVTPEFDKIRATSNQKKIHSQMMKTNIALYDNKIFEESNSKKKSPIILGEKTVSSKVHRSPNLRSNSVNIDSKNTLDGYITSMIQVHSNSNLSHNSNEHNINTFQNIKVLETLNNVPKKTPAPLKNHSMFPNRQFSRLHQSNNILPNSEDIRMSKIRPKPSIQSNVPYMRFQNYQTIVSLKSEMNLKSKKKNYKKKTKTSHEEL